MTKFSFDALVLFTRASPFAVAQLRIVDFALRHCKKTIVLIGSSDGPRDPRTPWSFAERKEMIEQSIGAEAMKRVSIAPIEDVLYDDGEWVRRVREIVASLTKPADRIGLVGHSSRSSGFYTQRFPEWGGIDIPRVPVLSGTEVRRAYYLKSDWRGVVCKSVPEPVVRFMADFQATEEYAYLLAQEQYAANYPATYGKGPFDTADALCTHRGRILLVRRGGEYGTGLLALPGGFAEEGETPLQTAIRELQEETSIAATEAELGSALVSSERFTDPHRDLRAHIRTTVHHFDLDRLENGERSVVAGDDAAETDWHEIEGLSRREMFADHFHIIRHFLAGRQAPTQMKRERPLPTGASESALVDSGRS